MVWVIGSSTAKDSIYGRLKLRPRPQGEPNPGFIHFPQALREARTEAFNADYFAQLTSEKVVTERNAKGRLQRNFVLPAGKRNEALDTFAYALAARMSLPYKLRGAVSDRASVAADEQHDDSTNSRDVTDDLPAAQQRPAGRVMLPRTAPAPRRLDAASVARLFRG